MSKKTKTVQFKSDLDWRWLFRQLKQYKQHLIYAHLIALAAVLVSVPIPLLMPLMVDEVLLDQPGRALSILQQVLPSELHIASAYIITVLLVTVALRAATVVLNVIQGRLFTIVAKSITCQLRETLLTQLQRISLREYEGIGSGNLSSHFVTDVETIDKFVAETLSRFVVSLLTVIGTAVVLLLIDWRLGAFILLCNPVVIYFSKQLGSRVKDLKRHENNAFAVFQQALTETLDAVQELRSANRQQHYLARVTGLAREVKQSAINYAWRSEAAGRFSFTIFLVGFELFRAVAMLMVLFSDLTVGQIFAVFGYLWFMMTPVNDLLGIQYAYYSATAAFKRLDQLQKYEQEPLQQGSADPFTGRTSVSISVQELAFSYNQESQVLKGVDLEIAAGEKVAIVGASGGGKSTLVQMLLGLYPRDSGQIRYQGIPVEQIGFDRIREHVCAVLQQPSLFNDTVRNNLLMGLAKDDAAIWQALKVAQLEQLVGQFPQGLDTCIGTRGIRLSGGQRQRMAIARMVLRDPKVVILDEATSALDTDTENRLHQALSAFLKDRTTIIIAHRLSAVRQADKVYVFEDGLICQSGHHDQLIQREGLYRTLYAST